MNVPLCVQSAGKPLHANTTESVTRVCTAAKRNSFAGENSVPEASGAADDVSHVQMLWADISAVKLVEFVSSRCSTRKRWRGSESTKSK